MRALFTILLIGFLQSLTHAQSQLADNQTPAVQPHGASRFLADDDKTQTIKQRFCELKDRFYANSGSDEALRDLEIFVGVNLEILLNAWVEFRDRIEMETRQNPDSAEAWHRFGRLIGDKDKAKEAFEKAIALKADYAEAYDGLGLYYLRPSWCGNTSYSKEEREFLFGKTIELEQKAIQLKPEYADAYATLGDAYDGLERQEEAITAYRQAIALNPSDKLFRIWFAELLQRNGKDEEAIDAFQVIAEQNAEGAADDIANRRRTAARSRFYTACTSLGALYRKTGQHLKALASYEALIQKGFDDYSIRLGMGLAYVAIGDKESALMQYEMMVKHAELEKLDVTREGSIKEAIELLKKIQAMP